MVLVLDPLFEEEDHRLLTYAFGPV